MLTGSDPFLVDIVDRPVVSFEFERSSVVGYASNHHSSSGKVHFFINPDGSFTVNVPDTKPGDYIVLRADMDAWSYPLVRRI